jgi:translation initiation factor 1
MSEICTTCGLPKEICACQTIEKETALQLRISARQERFRKWVTLVEGLKGEELARATKELKRGLACGGTSKNDAVILQGDHRHKAADILVRLGYPKDVIHVA